MPTPLHFRLMVIGSYVMGLAGMLVDAVIPSLMPESVTKAINAEMPGEFNFDQTPSMYLIAQAVVVSVLGIGLLVLLFVSTIGLLRFRPWARSLAVASTAVVLLIGFLPLGPTAMSSIALSLFELSNMLWGAALAMAWCSPLSERFSRKSVRVVPTVEPTLE
jgi:hypothetical protein